MDINKLERANILTKSLLPKVAALLCSHRHANECVGEYLNDLKCDKEFNYKFTQLLKETKQRLQKEFDEL